MTGFWARHDRVQQCGVIAAMAALLAAILLRPFMEYNVDVSSLSAFAEKLIDNQGLYTEAIEINPPGAMLIYVPAVLLGRLSGIFPEIIIEPLVFLLFAGSFLFFCDMLVKSRLLAARHVCWLAVAAIVIFLIMPTRNFAQREHIGAIALLPLLAWTAARCAGIRIGGWRAVVAGAGLCLALMCKPHFLLAILPVWLYLLWRTRSIASIFDTPWLAGALLTAAYLASIWIFFGTYLTEIIPLMLLVYVPNQRGLNALLSVPSFTLWVLPAVFVAIALMPGKAVRRSDIFSIYFLASSGMIAAYFVQGKGWPYHAYPALAFMLMAVMHIIIASPQSKNFNLVGKTLVAFTAATVIFVNALWLNLDTPRYSRELAAAVMRASKHAKMAYIGNEAGDIYPMTRLAGGEQVVRTATLGLTRLALTQLGREKDAARVAQLKGTLQRNRSMFLEDVTAKKPDVVLLQNEFWPQWAEKDLDIKKFLSGYARAETIGGIVVMKRRSE